MWLLSYAAPVTKSMQIFNTFTYFTVPSRETKFKFPSWLAIEIGVLAGRLYFDHSEYENVLAWLGVSGGEKSNSTRNDSSMVDSESTNSADSTDSSLLSSSGGLSIKEPLKFLIEWLTYCRQTDDIMHTPLGYVCQRRALREGHAFFVSTVETNDGGVPLPSRGPTDNTNDDEEESDDDSDWDHLEHDDLVDAEKQDDLISMEKRGSDEESFVDAATHLVDKMDGLGLDA